MRPADGGIATLPAVGGSIDYAIGEGVGAVVVHNESPNLLIVNMPGLNVSRYIPALTSDVLVVPNSQPYGGKLLVFVAQAMFTANIVSNFIVCDVYAMGEKVPGTYPSGLVRQANIAGGSVGTDQVIQDGQASGRTLVESTPTGIAQTVLLTTDGQLMLQQPTSTTGPGLSDTFLSMVQTGAGAHAYRIIMTSAGLLDFFDSTDNSSMVIMSHAGGMQVPIGLSSIGGQSSVGGFGVPVIVAQSARQLISNNTLTTLLTFSTANGVYRLNVSLVSRTAGSSSPSFTTTYTDASGTAAGATFYGREGTSWVPINGTVLAANSGPIDIAPLVLAMNAGTLTIKYQSGTSPASDTVSATVERLQ